MALNHAKTKRMTRTYPEKKWLLLAVLGLGAGMLLCLGRVPLYLEEPRRALIALEMFRSGNYWAATQFGEWYYYKPPVFNWVLIGFARLGGGFDEFWLRLPTVLSVWGIAALLWAAGRRWVGEAFARVSALSFLGFGSILFYFSTLAEIDLFYALIVFAGLWAVYYFGEKERYLWLFLSAYLSCAIGVLTKGMPSFAFTAISLLVYFVDKGRFRELLSARHFLGIGLLALLLGGYTWKYSAYHNPLFLIETLFGESSERTIGHSVGEFVAHLFVFPFDFLKDLLPGALLGVFLLRPDVRGLLLERHPFIRFCTLMLLANIALYWISPGTRMRYVYPLFPLAALLLAWAWERRAEAPVWTGRFFHTSIVLFCLLAALALAALPFVPDLAFLPYRQAIAVGGASGFVLLAAVSYKRPRYALTGLFLALALGRIAFDLTVLPLRAHRGEAVSNQSLAENIYELTGDAPLYYYGEEKVLSFTSSFYLSRLRRQPVVLQDQLRRGSFYLLPAEQAGKKDSVMLKTRYEGIPKVLILKK